MYLYVYVNVCIFPHMFLMCVCVCVCVGVRFQGTHDPWLTSPSAHPTTPDRDPKLTHTHTCTFPPSEVSIRKPAVQAPNYASYA